MLFRLFFSSLFAALLFLPNSNAGVVNNTLEITLTGGTPLDGTVLSGSFAYNDALLTGMGIENVGPVGTSIGGVIEDPDFSIAVDVFGVILDETNDIDFPDFPLLEFVDGDPTSFDLIFEQGVNGTNFGSSGIIELSFDSDLVEIGMNTFSVDAFIVVRPIPEPGTLLAFGCLTAAGLVRRRRT